MSAAQYGNRHVFHPSRDCGSAQQEGEGEALDELLSDGISTSPWRDWKPALPDVQLSESLEFPVMNWMLRLRTAVVGERPQNQRLLRSQLLGWIAVVGWRSLRV
jgi:hypothetical protein